MMQFIINFSNNFNHLFFVIRSILAWFAEFVSNIPGMG